MENSLSRPLTEILEYQQLRILNKSRYFGVPIHKNPLDMWVYQEIFYKNRPDVVIEIGTYKGGSALAMAHWMDQLGGRIVISIDIDHSLVESSVWNHKRIKLITGDANSQAVIDKVSELIVFNKKVMIIEDSSHEYQQTLDILNNYSQFVTEGQYFIVEDTICGHGLHTPPTLDPMGAVYEFLKTHKEFEIDKNCEDFIITWNSNGYLKRKG